MRGLEDIMRQAQAMQSKMQQLQEELGKKTVEGASGGGMVKVVCTGQQQIVRVTIDKAAVDAEDLAMLEDLVAAAVNDALRLSQAMRDRELAALTGGLQLPGFM